ncbi:MAG: 50S ribosomal protein L30 [Solirubrobacterales bacterium]|nr:50S ribosomal protein L30 [Solirubrobacterales bacterium]
MGRLTITQTRSPINTNPSQRKTLEALGLGKLGRSVQLEESPQLKGQIRVVEHLVKVEEA